MNESLMKLRKRKSDRSVPLDEPVDTGEDTVVREIAVWDENPEQKYSREELGQILDEAVEGLRPAFRTVFVLRDIEELSTEETAEALGISVPAVKSRLLRARLAASRETDAFLQTERGRRLCLHVRSSFRNSTIISMKHVDIELRRQIEAHITRVPELFCDSRYHQEDNSGL